MNKFSYPSLINLAVLLSIATPTLVSAQPAQPKIAQPKIVYISPQGNDSFGSQTYRTITAAIAANPQSGTIFQLSNGTYSEATGESFPIRLPKGAILRGDPNLNGSNVVISGGGRFISSTFASQNIAIAAATDSRIEGVTITNSNPRGYGLWLESSRNVIITNNSFVRSTHDGIFLTGSANAYIGNNLFANNRGSGLSAIGTSTGEIRDNRFENTGFGLSIGQQSQVVVANNNISRNIDGIIISNTAQPTLRGNAIADNQRNGLVVLSSANGSPRPDLGTTSSLGNNTFRNNREFDINNATTIPLAAVGNQLNRSRVNGLLDLSASISPVTKAIANPVTFNPAPLPSILATSVNPNITPNISTNINTNSAIAIPIESNPTPVFAPTKPNPNSLINNSLTNNSPTAIVIEREYNPKAAPMITTLPPAMVDPLTGQAFQYRVIVPTISASNTQRVKTIVPQAFRLFRNGRTVLQVGAYSDRTTATQLVQKLSQSGLSAEIIPYR
jgi:parallel beta-helix repeat protein